MLSLISTIWAVFCSRTRKKNKNQILSFQRCFRRGARQSRLRVLRFVLSLRMLLTCTARWLKGSTSSHGEREAETAQQVRIPGCVVSHRQNLKAHPLLYARTYTGQYNMLKFKFLLKLFASVLSCLDSFVCHVNKCSLSCGVCGDKKMKRVIVEMISGQRKEKNRFHKSRKETWRNTIQNK